LKEDVQFLRQNKTEWDF